MQIYWTLKGIPELSSLSRQERMLRWQKACRRTFRHWQTWASLAVCAICAGIGAYFGGLFEMGLIGVALGGGIGGFIFSQVGIAVARRHYQHILLGKQPRQNEMSNA